jgi:hypothetical protein
MTDTRQDSYNKFITLSTVPYNIIKYLIDNDEVVWKYLYYNSADAWKDSKNNLTSDQKAELIYDGVKPINDCRIFMDTGADDAWRVEAAMLRISVIEAVPQNYVYGNICIAFETYVHYSINTLGNYTPRNLSIIQRLLEVFNGADIVGLGRLYFDARATTRSRLSVAGQIPYKGMNIVLCTKSLG